MKSEKSTNSVSSVIYVIRNIYQNCEVMKYMKNTYQYDNFVCCTLKIKVATTITKLRLKPNKAPFQKYVSYTSEDVFIFSFFGCRSYGFQFSILMGFLSMWKSEALFMKPFLGLLLLFFFFLSYSDMWELFYLILFLISLRILLVF